MTDQELEAEVVEYLGSKDLPGPLLVGILCKVLAATIVNGADAGLTLTRARLTFELLSLDIRQCAETADKRRSMN